MQAGASAKTQLLCALAILAALAALLVATPGGRAGAPADAATGLDPGELTRIAVRATPRVAKRVEAIRGLDFAGIPEPEVVAGDYLNELSAQAAQRAEASQAIAADEAQLRMLGLLEPGEQLESIFGAAGDLAAAAYDTEADRLYVVADAVVANRALVEFVLAHELTHAVEDQRFGLAGGAGRGDDAALALLALNEGTATSLMIQYASRHLSAADLIAASAGLDSGTGGVPKFYADQLLWEYTGGARFVAALRRLAGGWKLADHALASRPPASTEQVLHVAKYVRDELPLPVEIEDRALRLRDWRRADRGDIGELSTRQLLEVGVDAGEAARAAAGWGGDSLELWRRAVTPGDCDPCRADFTLVADWRLDSPTDVAELGGALGKYLVTGLGGSDAGDANLALPGGTWAAIRTAGDEIALVLAPDRATAAAVAADQVRR